jgi:hypothetical protein
MILSDDGAFTAAYPLPHSVDELTAAWLTHALRERFPAVTVEAVEIVQVIRGTATKVRLHAHYAGGAVTGGPPETLCVKGGLDDRWRVKAVTRVMKPLGLLDPAKAYEVEVRFYNHLAPTIHASLPDCWFAGVDAQTGQGILVLEDLVTAGVSFGDPTIAWRPDRVAAALEVQAAWHAATWHATHETHPWVPQASVVRALTPVLLSRFNRATFLRSPKAPTLVAPLNDRRRVAAAFSRMWEQHSAEATCITHGDAHVGNAYVDARGQPAFFDWQAMCFGPPLHDVAYFITGALATDDRRKHEKGLLDHYLAALSAHGAPSPTHERAWDAYRRYSLHGFLWAVTPPVLQPWENIRAMAQRHMAAIIDLDTFGALGG